VRAADVVVCLFVLHGQQQHHQQQGIRQPNLPQQHKAAIECSGAAATQRATGKSTDTDMAQ
jgi:hypothetical protein